MSPREHRLSKKKEASFFELLENQCNELVAAGKLLDELVKAPQAARKELSKRIHDHEHNSDEISHKYNMKVSKSFVTPFDRQDMYELSSNLDDCLDAIDEAADLICLYQMGELPQGLLEQVEIINKCCELTLSIPKTLAKRDKAIREYWLGINQLENVGDKIFRRQLADLFTNPTDPFTTIKIKDIIEGLENATDGFENLASLVEAIIIKES